jgi:alkylation response protein AidB-like acyl-CoA dehydrogenase
MDLALTRAHEAARAAGREVGARLQAGWSAPDVIAAVTATGVGPGGDGVREALLIEGLAHASPGAGLVLALHRAAARIGVAASAASGSPTVVGLALTGELVPTLDDGCLSGEVSWAASVVPGGRVVVGAQEGARRVACAVVVDANGVSREGIEASGLADVPWARLTFASAPCEVLGPPEPAMTWARVLMAAVALGIGRRALDEALSGAAVYERRGPGGEQTLQGLVADAATDLEAATIVTWSAVSAGAPSLSEASMAKLLATAAAQGAVLRATQVVGVSSFERGHVLARLAEDVRAIELFGGRTEALRESISLDS